MNTPLVSVVIPCFRQGHFLRGAIDSALGQSHPAVEVVVVNDGSDDDTDAVARSYGDRIRYVQQSNQGLPAARNAGIAVARGKYLLFLDSDDHIHTDSVAWLVETAAGRDDVLCVMGYQSFAGEDGLGKDHLPSRFPSIERALLCDNLGPPHTYLSARESVLRTGGFDTSGNVDTCEDWDMWQRLVFDGATLVSVNKIGAYYRQHSQSMSRNLARMARGRAGVMSRIRTHVRKNRSLVRRLGVDPNALWRTLTADLTREHLDAAYGFRERGDYLVAIKQYCMSLARGNMKLEAIAGLCKLPLHRLLNLAPKEHRGRPN